jgi:UDP-N-acetylmuramate--alanine ligase
MLPLATILKGRGARVGGSDRSFDQGRTPEKFNWLALQGFDLHPQDGSGITSAEQVLVASAAIEEDVPEVVRARELGCERMSRAQLLAALFNASGAGIAVGGTSGKSTVTAMLGWILYSAGRDPTIVNGAVMKNFVAPDMPFASARVGLGRAFVAEVDESDGSIALYQPEAAVLTNISLDHKSMEQLRVLFGSFAQRSRMCALNFDDLEVRELSSGLERYLSFAIDHPDATIGIEPGTIVEGATEIGALLVDRREDVAHALQLAMPGRHNLSNGLAAVTGALAAGVPVHDSVIALRSFAGIARRFDIIGTSASGITVIDDFGHNPEKCRATLRTLKAHSGPNSGRVIAFFQPHGYGPLRQMGHELAQTFARELGRDDVVVLCDPVFFGGTVDRSEGSERIVELIRNAAGPDGPRAEYLAAREDCGRRMIELARPGDRIAVMGARDDTLTGFAQGLLARLD